MVQTHRVGVDKVLDFVVLLRLLLRYQVPEVDARERYQVVILRKCRRPWLASKQNHSCVSIRASAQCGSQYSPAAARLCEASAKCLFAGSALVPTNELQGSTRRAQCYRCVSQRSPHKDHKMAWRVSLMVCKYRGHLQSGSGHRQVQTATYLRQPGQLQLRRFHGTLQVQLPGQTGHLAALILRDPLRREVSGHAYASLHHSDCGA